MITDITDNQKAFAGRFSRPFAVVWVRAGCVGIVLESGVCSRWSRLRFTTARCSMQEITLASPPHQLCCTVCSWPIAEVASVKQDVR